MTDDCPLGCCCVLMAAAAGMWLQITMVLAALVSSRKSPYKLAADNRQEQMSFLGLSLVLSITSSGVPYSGGWTYWHAFLIGANFYLCLPPCLNDVEMSILLRQAQDERKERTWRIAWTRSVCGSTAHRLIGSDDVHHEASRESQRKAGSERGAWPRKLRPRGAIDVHPHVPPAL